MANISGDAKHWHKQNVKIVCCVFQNPAYKMDQQLQQIFRIQPLLQNVMTYRTDTNINKLLKETYCAEIKNLLNVDLIITHTELKLPCPDEVPPVSKQEIKPNTKLDAVLADCDSTMEGLKMLQQH